MENNLTTQADLISINENEGSLNTPYYLGVASISLLVLSAFFEFVIYFGLGLISFLLAFVISIAGVISVSKYKNRYTNLTHQQNKRLQAAKWLSLITLILSSLIILGIVSLIILIGNQGFGR